MKPKVKRRADLEKREIDYALALEKVNSNPKLKSLSKEEKLVIIDNIMLAPFLDLTNDYAFKKVLGNNENILKVLISDILSEDVVEVDYISNEIPVLSEDDKHARFDVNCTLHDGRKMIIEMQNYKEDDLHQRLFYYGASLSASQVKKGIVYEVLKPTYVIAFLNFERPHLPIRDDKMVFCYSFLETETNEKYESDPLTFYICEMPRLNKGVRELDSPIEKWLYILRNCGNFASGQQDVFGDRYSEFFTQARSKHLTEEELMEYFDSKISEYRARMLTQAGFKDGLREGIAKGAAKRNAEIAKAMLAEGLEASVVAKCTGLTPEEINALK